MNTRDTLADTDYYNGEAQLIPLSGTNMPLDLHLVAGTPGPETVTLAPIGQLAILQRSEVTFIESNVADLATLLQGLGPHTEVHLLDAKLDGLQQIATILAGRSGIDALHIIAHGATAAINFGALQLDNGNLAAHTAELRSIGASLAPDADILLYSCDTGQGDSGAAFINRLAEATGADLAASSNLTGSAALGGDWQLEVSSGHIETTAVVEPALAALYSEVLSISSATLTFSTLGNVASGGSRSSAATDVIYKVNGNSAYQLRINGLSQEIFNYTSLGCLVSDYTPSGGETEIDFSFDTGQVFTPTSLKVGNYLANSGVQKLIFKGYDAAGNMVGTAQTISTSSSAMQYVTINFSGLTNITKLKLTADPTSSVPGKLDSLIIDDLGLSNIQSGAPTVSSVSSSSANGTYKAGQVIAITVTFSVAVDVSGTPQLKLANGATGQTINYASGTGTTTLTFNYTVQAGDTSSDLDVFSSSALTLNGGSIVQHGTATNATLTLPSPGAANSLGANKNIVIDTTAPSAPSALALLAASDHGTSSSDGLTNLTTPTITGNAETGATVTLYDTDGTTVLGSGTASAGAFSIVVTPALSAGVHSITAKASDAAGNVSSASTALTTTIDTTAPSVAITSNVASLKAGETATITFTFSEDPGTTFTWNGTSGDVTVSGGTLGAISGTGLTRSATFTPTASTNAGSASITVAASSYTDAAGNNGGAGTTPSLVYDTLAPGAPSAPTLIAASDSGIANSDRITRSTSLTFTGTAEAGASVTLYDSDGITVLGSGVATGGNWSISTVALGDVVHNISAKASDAAGNLSSASSTTAVTVDTLAPTVVISSDRTTLKAGETATITFTFSEDPGAGFSWNGSSGAVTLSGGTLSALSGSGLTRSATFTPTALTEAGTASIAVAAAAYTDKAGNDGVAGSALNLSYDTLAPAVPSTPVLSAASDSGVSNSDQITRNTTPTLTGTADSGTTVRLYDSDGTTLLGSSIASAGVWSITTTAMAVGTHTVTASAIDAAGNASALSSGLSITIDTSAPTLTITSNVATLKVGETATITFTFSEDPGSGFGWDGTNGAVTLLGATLGAISGTGLTRSATLTPINGIDAGSASISVAGGAYTDRAGNPGTAATALLISYDTLAPAAPSTPDLAAASDSGLSNSDNITNVTTPTFSGSAASGTSVTLYDTDGTSVLGTTVATGGVWSIASTTLAAGVHQISAKTSDAAGNSATSAPLTVEIATTQPTLAITSSASTLRAGQTATITFTFSSDPGSSFSWDGTSGDVVVVGGTLGAISGAGLTRSAIFTPTAGVNSGSASITVAAGSYTDAVGNLGIAATTPALTYDTLAPAAAAAPVLSAASDTGISASDGITSVVTPVFTGSADAHHTITLYDSDGITVLGTASADGGGNWSITSSTLAAGVHSISVRQTDAAGNSSPASAQLPVTIMTASPGVAISSNLAQLSIGQSATITFTFSADPGASFNWDGSTGDVVVTGGTLSAISGSGLTRSAVLTPTASVNGATASVSVTAASYQDAAGNNGTAGVTPAISYDTLAPTAPSTPDLSTASDDGNSSSDNITGVMTPSFSGSAEAGSTVRLYDTDGVTVLGTALATGGNWTIVSSTLAAGSHTVTAVATDAAGNVGAASAGLSVQILAPLPPAVVPTLAITSELLSLNLVQPAALITFTFSVDPGTSFDSSKVLVTGGTLGLMAGSGLVRTAVFTPAAGINHGQASITVAASSQAGQGANLNLDFDTQAPAAAAALHLAAGSDSGVSALDNLSNVVTPTVSGFAESGASVTLLDSDGVTELGSSVASNGQWSIVSSVLSDGPHNLTALVRDAAGNTAPVSAPLKLRIDTQAPTLTITSNVSQLKAGESAVLMFSFSDNPGAGFSAQDVTVTGGTLSALVGTGMQRAAVFTPSRDVDAGSGLVQVAAGAFRDAAGNASTAASSPVLHYDTALPGAPSTPVLAAGSDSGSSSRDGLTQVAQPTFSGSATAGASVVLLDSDGITVLGTTSADLDGRWSITSQTLADGLHSVSAVQRDAAGNLSPASAACQVVIDTTAPLAPTSPALLAASDNGDSSTDNITSISSPVLLGHAAGAATVTLFDGATVLGTATVNDAVWQFASPELADGSHRITALARDAAGNTSPVSDALVLTVVSSGPASRPTGLTLSQDSGSSGSDLITNVAAQTLRGALSAPLQAGEFVQVSFDQGTSWVRAAAVAGASTWSASGILSEGSRLFQVQVVNQFGGKGALFSQMVTLDTSAPSAPSLSLASVSDSGVSSTDGVTNISRPQLTGTAAPGALVELYDGAGSSVIGSTTAGGDGHWSITLDTLIDGVHALSARQTDAAGNQSAASTTLPLTVLSRIGVPDAPRLALASDSGLIGDGITSSRTPLITGTALPDVLVQVYADAVLLGTASTDAAGGWSLAAPELSAGLHTLTVTQLDRAGNLSAPSTAFTLTIAAAPISVDGAPVTVAPVVLPGGSAGTLLEVPVIQPDRMNSDGSASVADIPLVQTPGASSTLLLAQLPVGLGLSASGGISAPANDPLEYLIKAIVASTPNNDTAEQTQLSDYGRSYLGKLSGGTPLLVETVTPVGASGTGATLTLTGTQSSSEHTALVIDARMLGSGNHIALQGVDFAAVIGKTSVTGTTVGQVLTGDAASQQFTVTAASASSVFAGGGDDMLQFGLPAQQGGRLSGGQASVSVAASVSTLHGGLAADTAVFAGARSDYQLEWHDGYVVVSILASPQLQAKVVNCETLQFADTSIAVQNRAELSIIAGLYQDLLGRQADLSGFEYWGNLQARGVSLGQIALSMLQSSEGSKRHAGFDGNAEHDVALLYHALFGRAADAGGLAFWTDAMQNRGVSLTQVVEGFMQSAEIIGHSKAAVDWNFQL